MKLKIISLVVIVVASIGGLLGNPLQVTAQQSPQTVKKGDNVTISVFVKDLLGTSVEGASVTTTVGDL